MSFNRSFSILSLVIFMAYGASAKENIGEAGKTSRVAKTASAGCSPASSSQDLNINNVRAHLLGAGDKWWDLQASPKYEIPKINPPGSAPSVCSEFAAAIWMGGIDAAGQLKIAAMTYRQNGNDFFPGPLDDAASTNQATCNLYDRHWVVYSSEIDTFITKAIPTGGIPNGEIPNDILIWPGKGNIYAQGLDGQPLTVDIDQELAPFYDADSNGIYDPQFGDYPVINPQCGNTYADQMIFDIYNDEGNIHTETGGQQIGVAVGELAFAFSTSDEVNNMTFYRYTIVNKANIPVGQFYMSAWCDPDLGCNSNDYVGCDVKNSIGYCYNGTPEDLSCGGEFGYGNNLPIVGTDYFEGPLDSSGKQLGMSTFVYYKNDFTQEGNPTAAVHYYNYMIGKWKDNSPIDSDVASGYGGSKPTHYMFPDDPGGAAFPATWSMCSASLTPVDVRYLQSSGPFVLNPGAINHITIGCVWVQQGANAQASCDANIGLLRVADLKAQALFDNCFKLIDGPDAPDLVIRELKDELIITLANKPTSNNYQESYKQADPGLKALAENAPALHIDSTYTFQGYAIYQLANSGVGATNLGDLTQAKLVAEVDIQDTVVHMVNYTSDPVLGLVPSYNPPQITTLANAGITHTFDVKNDLFSSEQVGTLVDFKTYYYTAIAFAHNYYKDSSDLPPYQQTPYLQGRRNFQVYAAIPHSPVTDQGGMVLNSAYGDSIPVTRIEGAGNGGVSLDLATGQADSILKYDGFYGPIVYQGKHGPISVKVIDPYELQNRDFVVTLIPDTSFNDTTAVTNYYPLNLTHDTVWAYNPKGHTDTVKTLTFISPKVNVQIDVYNPYPNFEFTQISSADISIPNDIIIRPPGNTNEDSSVGISITLAQVPNVGDTTAATLGYIEATLSFQDSLVQWLTGVQDLGVNDYQNWIRAGQYAEPGPCPATKGGPDGTPPAGYTDGFWDDYYLRFPVPAGHVGDCNGDTDVFYDPQAQFGAIINGTWSPYCLAANDIDGDLDTGGAYPSPYSYGPGFTVDYRYKATGVNYPAGAFKANYRDNDNTLRLLQSVDLVLTSDPHKWTQCVAVEMNEDSSITDGHALKGFYRQAPSYTADANGNYSQGSDSGRATFPGYAINVETGERLNIMFGEDSWLKNENGGDMLWNPTGDVMSPLGQVLFGGRHCIYIMDTRYDSCNAIHAFMQAAYDNLPDPITGNSDTAYNYVTGKLNVTGIEYLNSINDKVYDHIMWTTMPTLDSNYTALNTGAGNPIAIPTTTTIKLRVRKPFMPYVADASKLTDPNNPGFPQYMFSTKGLQPDTMVHQVAKNALDSIRVVPNPYYAYSAYETSQLDNEVKIVNLPANATISIFSIDGTLIRQFQRAVVSVTSEGVVSSQTNQDNTMEWNLKNTANIPISSGVYLIYVNAPGLGQKVIKWFGVLRPTDLNTF